MAVDTHEARQITQVESHCSRVLSYRVALRVTWRVTWRGFFSSQVTIFWTHPIYQLFLSIDTVKFSEFLISSSYV